MVVFFSLKWLIAVENTMSDHCAEHFFVDTNSEIKYCNAISSGNNLFTKTINNYTVIFKEKKS